MEASYRVLAHTADTGIEVEAPDYPSLVAAAAYGMFDLMYDLSRLTPTEERSVELAGDDRAELLVDVLSELLFLGEAEGLAFCRFGAEEPAPGMVRVVAGGAPLDAVELRGPPIKAVTYHDLLVAETPDGWRARVVFDV